MADRQITEAEYRTWMEQNTQTAAGWLSRQYGHLLPEGVHFEVTTPSEAIGEP